jgi:hypothetical protein
MSRAKIYLPKTHEEFKKLSTSELAILSKRYFNKNVSFIEKTKLKALWYKVQCDNMNLRIEQKHKTKLTRYSVNPELYISKSIKTKYYLKPGAEIIKNYKALNIMF